MEVVKCIIHVRVCLGGNVGSVKVFDLSSPNPLGLTSIFCYQNSLAVGTSCCSFLDSENNKDLNQRTISVVNVQFFVTLSCKF